MDFAGSIKRENHCDNSTVGASNILVPWWEMHINILFRNNKNNVLSLDYI